MSNKCGIYQIRCVISGRIYIGSSRSIYGRWHLHRASLRKNKTDCRLLLEEWRKHGEENFEFSVLEECPFEELYKREQYWIDLRNPELNLLRKVRTMPASFAKAACPEGHAYTVENTYTNKKGVRICRTCNRLRVAKHYENESHSQRQKRRDVVRAYYSSNREKLRAEQNTYAAARREEKSEYDRAYRERPETNARRRAAYWANPEVARAKRREQYHKRKTVV